MLNKLAWIDAGWAQLTPAPVFPNQNDNHPCPRAPLPASARTQRLACHWRPAGADGRLECYWQIEPADEAETLGQSFILGTSVSAALRALGTERTAQTDGRPT